MRKYSKICDIKAKYCQKHQYFGADVPKSRQQ